eukprot:g13599.t1
MVLHPYAYWFFRRVPGHGGGEARISPQSPIWQTLAAQGFLIVSCEYRRRRGAQWPVQLNDCRAALMWLVREGAAQFHGDLEDLTIAGASAGGHLVALLLAEAVKKQLPLPVWPGPLRVLQYMAAEDPYVRLLIKGRLDAEFAASLEHLEHPRDAAQGVGSS